MARFFDFLTFWATFFAAKTCHNKENKFEYLFNRGTNSLFFIHIYFIMEKKQFSIVTFFRI